MFVGLRGYVEPGSCELGKVANKWFYCWYLLIEPREMLWHPTKSEIEDWMELKTLVFALKESEGSQLRPENWIQ